ncbi:MAG: 2-oxo acid dehydrogenase subunit E2 [Ruminococcaceae bacterium]|nr:2-oxo acid dehydrogenase subunit E2 [Oscillospiraceae bacterium]
MEREVIPAPKIRKIVAKRMLESWQNSPRVSFTMRIDAEKMMDLRKKLNAGLKEGEGKISYNTIIMKACAIALMEFPDVNSCFDGENITRNPDANIGLAVDTEAGLMVPNIKQVQNKTLRQISDEMDSAIERARIGKLKIDDMSGGTFTVTSLGGMGIEHATPIINPPELAILGVYTLTDTPVAKDGQVIIRPLLTLVLVADHRLIDGALAARFFGRIKEVLETCEGLE